MSTRRPKSFDELAARIESDPEHLYRRALMGFIHGIDRLLDQGGLRRADLADRTGKPESTISRNLNGKQNLTIKTMVEMAEALDAAVHVHVERRDVRGGWVPLSQMKVATVSEEAGSDITRRSVRTKPAVRIEPSREHSEVDSGRRIARV